MSFTNVNNTEKKVLYDDIHETHIGKLCLARMKSISDKVHQIDFVTDFTETHGTIRERSIRVAQAMKSRGIGVGDVISLCGPNYSNMPLPLLASFYIGSAAFPFSENQTPSELSHTLSLGKPRIVFCDMKQAGPIDKMAKELGLDLEIVVFDNSDGKYTPFSDFLKDAGPVEDFAPTEFDPETTIAIIASSSGTTGLPKGVCLTHQSIALVIQIPTKHLNQEDFLKFQNINFSTLFWLSGILTVVISGVLGQIRLYTKEPYTPELMMLGMEKYKPTCAVLNEYIVNTLLAHPKIKHGDFGCLRLILVLGSALADKTKQEFLKVAPNAWLKNEYGLTETSGPLATTPLNGGKPNSCGKALAWVQWRIVDIETGEQVGIHKSGELQVKAPGVFQKYYNNPEATKDAFIDGWFKTGDLAYVDEDNYIFVVDRIKEVIKFRAIQLYPSEVEALIETLDGIFKACVVAKPDKLYGEVPMAFVEKLPGSKVSIEEIKNIVKDTLSDHKQLRGGVVFLDKLPLTPSGKVDRKSIKLLAKKSNE